MGRGGRRGGNPELGVTVRGSPLIEVLVLVYFEIYTTVL